MTFSPWEQLRGSRWVEVDTGAILHNLNLVRQRLQPGVRLLAVVKADAYGHGAVEVARTLVEGGADMLGVTTVEEGVELRQGGIQAPVLVFGPVLPEEVVLVASYRLIPSLPGPDQLEPLAAAAREEGRTMDVYIKVETGMGRTGVMPSQIVSMAHAIRGYPELKLAGVYSHLAAAQHNPALSRRQFERLAGALAELEREGINPGIRHICNSAAALLYPDMHLDMVRVGTLLYGQHPGGPGEAARLGLRDPWQVKARIIHLRDVQAGTGIGYGQDYITPRATRVGVIAFGYADGFAVTARVRPRTLRELAAALVKTLLSYWGRGGFEVLVHGRAAPVVGRVGMQLSMVDLGHLPAVHTGDEVVIATRRLNTNPRLPRVYVRDGRPYRIRTLAGDYQFEHSAAAD